MKRTARINTTVEIALLAEAKRRNLRIAPILDKALREFLGLEVQREQARQSRSKMKFPKTWNYCPTCGANLPQA